jgi:hypothetical protein
MENADLAHIALVPFMGWLLTVNLMRQFIIMIVASWALATLPEECRINTTNGYNELGFTVMLSAVMLFSLDLMLAVIWFIDPNGAEWRRKLKLWAYRVDVTLFAVKIAPWIMGQVVAFGGSDDCSHYRYTALIITITQYACIVVQCFAFSVMVGDYILLQNMLTRGVIALHGNAIPVVGGFTWPEIHKLKQIQVQTYQPELADQHKFLNDNRECVCCMVAYAPNDRVYILEDGHHAHEACMDIWFRQHHNCPVCREAIAIPNGIV